MKEMGLNRAHLPEPIQMITAGSKRLKLKEGAALNCISLLPEGWSQAGCDEITDYETSATTPIRIIGCHGNSRFVRSWQIADLGGRRHKGRGRTELASTLT